jgi:hypothetical protein
MVTTPAARLDRTMVPTTDGINQWNQPMESTDKQGQSKGDTGMKATDGCHGWIQPTKCICVRYAEAVTALRKCSICVGGCWKKLKESSFTTRSEGRSWTDL